MATIKADSDVTGLVLAGGRSTRFGDVTENKAVATFGERTLLERAVDVLAAATGQPPVIAVHAADQRERYAKVLSDREVTFALDDPAFDGPLAGVFGGSPAVDSPWVFCCGCDMPLLSPDGIQVARQLPSKRKRRFRCARTPTSGRNSRATAHIISAIGRRVRPRATPPIGRSPGTARDARSSSSDFGRRSADGDSAERIVDEREHASGARRSVPSDRPRTVSRMEHCASEFVGECGGIDPDPYHTCVLTASWHSDSRAVVLSRVPPCESGIDRQLPLLTERGNTVDEQVLQSEVPQPRG